MAERQHGGSTKTIYAMQPSHTHPAPAAPTAQPVATPRTVPAGTNPRETGASIPGPAARKSDAQASSASAVTTAPARSAHTETDNAGSPGYIQMPNCRPFVRCPLATKFERVGKVGEGTFG